MQSINEIVEIIQRDDEDVSTESATLWATYLQQLSGCHLYSAASANKDKAAWLKQRKVGIGGSEIAAILGESGWSSPRKVWMDKLGMFDDVPQQQSEQARWGNLLETAVAEEWGVRNNRKWINIPVILQSDSEPWLLANIDGFTLSDDCATITGILEIKTTSAYNLDVWENGPLPFNYICQTMWYCGITGLKTVELVCLVGGQRLFNYTLPFDAELFKRECDAARIFWNENVLKGVEPQATEVDKEILKNEAHDDTLPAVVIEDAETDKLADMYVKLRDKISELTKVKDAVHARLYLVLGNGTQAVTLSHTLTLSYSARRSCNFELLASEFPEAYAECVSDKVSASLRVK